MSALEKVLEMASELPRRDQVDLVEILSARLRSSEAIIQDAEESRADFDAGNYRVSNADEIMRDTQR
jgi:hypothetical protein